MGRMSVMGYQNLLNGSVCPEGFQNGIFTINDHISKSLCFIASISLL